ncbi:MAG: hypothetical protein ACE5D6_03935, partial [Candidatus Zixiibacteriota bacterium]
MSKQNWRIIITAILVVVAVIAFWKTFTLWTMTDAEKEAMTAKDPGTLLELQQKAIRLGLDLQGGIHVVLRVKMEELDAGSRSDAVDRAIQVIRNRIDGLGVAEPVILKQGNDRILVDLPGYTDAERAEELIGQTALLQFKLLETFENTTLLLTKMDSVIYEYEQSLVEAPADTTEAATAETDSVEIAEATPSDEVSSEDILAELMGDSSVDTSDIFGFDEDDLGIDERPLSGRLETALYNNQTATNWSGFAISKR